MKEIQQQTIPHGRWILAMTGASGISYALRLLEVMYDLCEEVHLVMSDAAVRVMHEEGELKGLTSEKPSRSQLNFETLTGRRDTLGKIQIHAPRDIAASIASGSHPCDGMVVVPCSMASLAAMANGLASNLIHRAADVVMKENRKLIIVPRETPLSIIHLENMTRLAKCGATILPAMPGFYHQPEEIQDLVDMLVMKILDQMGYSLDLVQRWGKDTGENREQRVLTRLSMLK